MTLTEAQTQFNSLADRLSAAKAAQKAALAALGRTPTDVWDTYPDELRAVTGGTGNYQESKTVTADPAGMTILPDEGYSGMLKAIIAAEPNFQPWNLVDGIEAWGITGTARPYVKPGGTDWPDVPATEEEMDEAVQEDDADAPIEDKMVLVDNEGNITTGYLYTAPDSGLMVYNGRVHPDIASVYTDEVKAEYPYAYICQHMAWRRLILSDTQLCAAHTDLGWNYLNSNGAEVNYQVYDWKNDFDSGWEYVGEYTNALNSSFEILWSNADVYSVEGALFMAGSAPIEYDGFTITAYDPTTTEFRAVGWRRVSKHTTGELAGQITKDDFTRTESGGWNYLKNIRSCTRDKLYYKGYEVWPDDSEYRASLGGNKVDWDCTIPENPVYAQYGNNAECWVKISDLAPPVDATVTVTVAAYGEELPLGTAEALPGENNEYVMHLANNMFVCVAVYTDGYEELMDDGSVLIRFPEKGFYGYVQLADYGASHITYTW